MQSNGIEHIYENMTPLIYTSGTVYHTIHKSKDDAMKALKEVISNCREFDEWTQKRLASGDRDAIGYWQSDIRIQNRNVTKWSD